MLAEGKGGREMREAFEELRGSYLRVANVIFGVVSHCFSARFKVLLHTQCDQTRVSSAVFVST